MPAPPRRRWFQFSLRTMFVVVTLLCLWLGWHARLVRERRAMMTWIVDHGGYVIDWDPIPSQVEVERRRQFSEFHRCFGDKPVYCVVTNPDQTTSEDRAEIARLFPEAFLPPPPFGDPFGEWHD